MARAQQEALNLARELMRAAHADRRGLETELEEVWRRLEGVAVTFAETLENLAGVVDSANLESEEGKGALRFALRHATERLEDCGIVLDGELDEAFDPKRHRAVENLTPDEGEELRVVKVLSRGVTCGGRRFKPAAVVVRRATEGG